MGKKNVIHNDLLGLIQKAKQPPVRVAVFHEIGRAFYKDAGRYSILLFEAGMLPGSFLCLASSCELSRFTRK